MMNTNEKVKNKSEPCPEPMEELLGSLTTYNATQKGESLGQSVRTSARVFKKMRQDTVTTTASVELSEKDKKDVKHDNADKHEKENGVHLAEAGLANKSAPSTAKQRMPKALWSTREKNLFFEALNEYGKDFDSITAYICNKVKKKGVPDTMTKNKHQVSHFYYRTWQKVSKFVKFGDDVKKVVQELYALINFGELRKRLVSGVAARAIPRLSELVWHGVVAVRSGGRTIRVRTPVCRTLRRLNRLEEWEEHLRLPTRVTVWMCPRDMEAWSRVHGAAHNPRVLVPTAPSRKLAPLLTFLHRRWLSPTDSFVRELLLSNSQNKYDSNILEQQVNSVLHQNTQLVLNVQKVVTPSNAHTVQDVCKNRINNHNGTENGTDNKKDLKNNTSKTDDVSISLDEGIQSLNHKNNLDVYIVDGQSDAVIDAANKTAKIIDDNNDRDECELNLENTTSKTTDAKNTLMKRLETNESQDNGGKWQLMEECKDLVLYVGPKPGITFNIPSVNVSEHLTSQRICLSAYKHRIVTNEPDGACQNGKTGGRFKNHKRQRKDSGDNEQTSGKKNKTDVESYWDKNDHFNIFDVDEAANDGMNKISVDSRSGSIPRDINDDRSNEEKDFIDYGEKEIFSEQEDDEKYNNETDGECDGIGNKLMKDNNIEDVKKSQKSNTKGNTKVKSKKEKDSNPVRDNSDNLDDNKSPNTIFKKNWNRDILAQQVKKGWSMHDSGDLTIGDLYLMFGIESKLELNYWWGKASPPFSEDVVELVKKSEICNNQIELRDTDIVALDEIKIGDKGKNTDSDKALLSPKLLTGIETLENGAYKKDGESVSPDHKNMPSANEDDPKLGSFNLVTKIINNPLQGDSIFPLNTQSTSQPFVVGQREPVVTISMRLKKLLSLSQLHMNKNRTNCSCGHVCSGLKGKRNVLPNINDNSLLNVSSDGGLGGKYSAQQKQLNKLKSAPCVQRNIGGIIRPETAFNQQHLLNKNKNKSNSIPVPLSKTRLLDLTGEVQEIPQPMQIKMEDNIPEVDSEVEIKQDEIFRCPSSKTKMTFNIQPYPATMNKSNVLDLGDLPRWTNRGMKKPKQEVVMRKLLPLAPNIVLMPQPIITIVPAAPPSVSQSRSIHKESKEPTPKQIYHEKSAIIKGNKDLLIASEPSPKPDITLFSSSVNLDKTWTADNVQTCDRTVIEPSNLSNLLDISLPSIGDVKDTDVVKHDDFSGLLGSESLSIPSMSPSRLLKDDNWLNADVHDFSLSSFLGHLESVPSSKLDSESSKKDSAIDVASSSRSTSEGVDTHLHCLMGDASIDYMAKFADLAAQVTADSTK